VISASVCYPPGWAGGDPGCDHVAPPDAAHDQDWRNFVGEVINRWGPAHPEYGLVGIEAWNEPNNPHQWRGDAAFVPEPHRFAELVNMASNKAETLAPSLKVLPGGLQPRLLTPPGEEGAILTNFMSKATQPNSTGKAVINADRISAMSFHLYANRTQKIEDVRTKLIDRQYNDLWQSLPAQLESKARWITEVGFPAQEVPNLTFGTPRRQAKRLADMYIRFGQRDPVSAFVVHRLIDGSGDVEDGLFGVADQQCNPRASYQELSRLVTGQVPASLGPC